jgi:ribonuclease HI
MYRIGYALDLKELDPHFVGITLEDWRYSREIRVEFTFDRPSLDRLTEVKPEDFRRAFNSRIPVFVETDGACAGNCEKKSEQNDSCDHVWRSESEPRASWMGPVITQNKRFTMLWQHFNHATNNTMELKAATEALRYVPEGMAVWITTDLQYVRNRGLEWMPMWKRKGWKNSKKQGVANAILWRRLDTEIGRHARVEFDWANAHSGTLLNECADQLAARGVNGRTYFPSQKVEVPPDEAESQEEFIITDEDANQCKIWDNPDQIISGTVQVKSVGLAHMEEQEMKEETFKKFPHDFLRNSRDSPKASKSEDKNDSSLSPELDENSAVQVVSGNGFQMDQEQ